MITKDEAEKKLKEIFGFEKFYDKQWETIEHLLKGQRILLIEKQALVNLCVFNFLLFFLMD